MRFKFFPDDSQASRPHSPQDGPQTGVQPGQLDNSPLEESEFDPLSIFPPEDSAAPPVGPTVGVSAARVASRTDAMARDDLRALLRLTETALEQSKSDATALRLDLSLLRHTGVQLAEEYTRLANTCRLTEERSALAADALHTIEGRLGPLEVVRDLANSTEDRLASLSQLAEEVRSRAAEFQAQKASIDHGFADVTLVTELLTTLEARVTKLTEKKELLARAESTVGDLEQRASKTIARLERRISEFEGQRATIEHALDEAARVTKVVATLDARVEALTGPEQVLTHAEAAVGGLERRVAEATAHVERRVSEFNGQKATIEQALDKATRVTEVVSTLDARVGALTGPDRVLAHAEASVGHLEQRVAEATAHVEGRVRDFEAQKVAIAQALNEASRVTDVVSALDARVRSLTGPDQVLARAEATVDHLGQRAVETIINLDQRVSNFDAQKAAIDEALDTATHVTAAVSALDTRVAMLTGPDQALRRAEETIDHLEQRVCQATADMEGHVDGAIVHLEGRVNEVTVRLEGRINEANVHLERRLDEATAHLERRASDFDAQKAVIEHALDEATQVADVVSALEVRVATITGPDQGLGRAEETVSRLEQRAAEAIAHLELRVNDLEWQKYTIDRALDEGNRVTNILSALNTRLETLAAPDQVLKRAEETVDHLERRAAETTVRLEQVTRAKDDLEHELANVQRQLQALTESVRHNIQLLASSEQRSRSDGSRAVSEPRTVSAVTASGGGKAGLVRNRLRGQRGMFFAALAVLGLLGAVAMRSSIRQPAQAVDTTRADVGESPSLVPVSPLGSRTLGVSISTMPDHPRRTLAVAAAGDIPSAAQPAKAPERTARTTPPSPRIRAVVDQVQEFSGALGVESVPAGASVFINQQRVGETPLQLPRLRAGSHVIWIEHEGYERWTRALMVPADKETRVNVTLQPLK